MITHETFDENHEVLKIGPYERSTDRILDPSIYLDVWNRLIGYTNWRREKLSWDLSEAEKQLIQVELDDGLQGMLLLKGLIPTIEIEAENYRKAKNDQYLAPPEGLEPPTPGSEDQCSIH